MPGLPEEDFVVFRAALMNDVRIALREACDEQSRMLEQHGAAVLEMLGGNGARSTAPLRWSATGPSTQPAGPAAGRGDCVPPAGVEPPPEKEQPPCFDEPFLSSEVKKIEEADEEAGEPEEDEPALVLDLQMTKDLVNPAPDVPADEKAAQKAEQEFALQHKEGVLGSINSSAVDRENMDEEAYNVEDYYWTSGIFQTIARDVHFQHGTLFVITANAVYIGVDIDNNEAPSFYEGDWGFQLMDHLFCAFFVFELVARFGAFQIKRNCMRDNWFKFDSALVALMVAETWIMPNVGLAINAGPLRLLRLLRLSRLVRLARSLPELVTMVKGMRVASRAVSSSLLMISLMIYVFGIVLQMVMSDTAMGTELEDRFQSLTWCMWTLLMDGTFMDSTSFVLSTLIRMWKAETILACLLFMAFILLSAMTVMNMLIGVLCEVVSAVAQDERDEAAIKLVKKTILVELKKFDADGDGLISRKEVSQVLRSKHALQVLRTLDIDAGCVHELMDMLFIHRDTEIPIKRFMELLVTYRGNMPTTVKHMVDMQSFSRYHIYEGIKFHAHKTDERMAIIDDELHKVAALLPGYSPAYPIRKLPPLSSPAGSLPITPTPPYCEPKVPASVPPQVPPSVPNLQQAPVTKVAASVHGGKASSAKPEDEVASM